MEGSETFRISTGGGWQEKVLVVMNSFFLFCFLSRTVYHYVDNPKAIAET